MATDRSIIKDVLAGIFRTASTTTAIVDPKGAVADQNKRCYQAHRKGSENADTNIAETPFAVVKRASKVRSISAQVLSTVAGNATNYLVISVWQRTNSGATAALIGSWNTHTSAQSGLTAFANHQLSLGTSNLAVAAGAVLTFSVGKVASGQTAIAEIALTADLEEV